jgi:kinesin family member C2/C3
MECGGRARAQHATDINEHCSRSHLILSVKVSVTSQMSCVRSSKTLSLVELAGSESLIRSNAAGDRLKEAQFINKSLPTLGDIFMALVEHPHHVPYRNSKLTYLLQESLGGDSKTLMFLNVSCDEADAGETLSRLQFAQRVAKVERSAASKHLDTSKHFIRSQNGAASYAVKETDGQIVSLQARSVNAERELRKLDENIEGLRRRATGSETEQ